jgi:putative acetyltransferase
MLIREEIPEDHDAIREVNRIAFGGNEEAGIVDRLRSAGVIVVSLVAIEDDEIVGHILFGELPIQCPGAGTLGGLTSAQERPHE